jgi:hypothetical protein
MGWTERSRAQIRGGKECTRQIREAGRGSTLQGVVGHMNEFGFDSQSLEMHIETSLGHQLWLLCGRVDWKVSTGRCSEGWKQMTPW